MSAPNAQRRLPARPSKEHLRKQAKRFGAAEKLRLAEAQRPLANQYGYRHWAALMRAVDRARGTAPAAAASAAGTRSALSDAAARADVEAVRRLLASGAAPDGERDETDTPLFHTCRSDAPAERRREVAALLLKAGAHIRRACTDRATALHMAAWRGPLELVEFLIRRGAIWWQQDKDNKEPLDYARAGIAADKAEIVALLDRPVINDPHFREAVGCIHRGDAAGLARRLDEQPRLLRERAIEPDCYPPSYFRDPKLFWFVANNPTLMKVQPANIVDVARTMIVRGVEQADLDYTLELVMSNGNEADRRNQIPLVLALTEAGAKPTPQAILVALAHWELRPVEALLARGLALTAPIAAALGRTDELAALLPAASPDERQTALGLAVINRRVDAARLCLDAGADPNAFLPVHAHSTPLHQASLHDDPDLMKLLIARGARTDIRDKLWNSTPLGWAVYMKKRKAEACLRELGAA